MNIYTSIMNVYRVLTVLEIKDILIVEIVDSVMNYQVLSMIVQKENEKN
ncbi:hypothetical protein [Myroides odoratus]|nr:hypothetical protein [Myroides odoratus]QQU04948.1 hypothetical protein I6I89_06585 [Myroides odoratus]